MNNGTIIGILLSFVILFILTKSKNPTFGVNLKRVYCPNCNLKQPILRSPKSIDQAVSGGYICENCKTKMNKFGDKI